MFKAKAVSNIWSKLSTHLRLGPKNILRVGLYRFGIKSGLHPVIALSGTAAQGPFFLSIADVDTVKRFAPSRWSEKAELFSAHLFALPDVPEWHSNPFNSDARADDTRPWFEIPDFDPAIGDIKAVWEYSRFDWLLAMAQRAALGDNAELARLNRWLQDWSSKNPPYFGPNWKCGQEASIRVMHLAAAAIIMNAAHVPLTGLMALIKSHLTRIAPTMSYAIGQQNNHGTSEAAALFIGGSWLVASGDQAAEQWMRIGRQWLENRSRYLIAADGTFSQYSVVYHRVMLDTYSLAEVWRQKFNLPPFSGRLLQSLKRAVHWQRQMMDEYTGEPPNTGANDGARLLPLTDAAFRDFRPSLQLAAAVFSDTRAIKASGQWNQPLHWLGVAIPADVLPPLNSETFDQGGFHVLRNKRAAAYLRYPRFQFRPSQCDILHTDLWVDGFNLLRDAGTFSYNSPDVDTAYFSSVRAHNTVQFDGREQMPRISRFLFGSWLSADNVIAVNLTSNGVIAGAGYRDWRGAIHHRTLQLGDDNLVCIDRIEGNAKTAVLRWRLEPGSWVLSGQTISNGDKSITVTANLKLEKIELVTGMESLEYLKKNEIPVLEVTCTVPTTIKTEIFF